MRIAGIDQPLQNVLMFKEMEALPLLLYQTPMVLDCLISFIVTKLHIFFISYFAYFPSQK